VAGAFARKLDLFIEIMTGETDLDRWDWSGMRRNTLVSVRRYRHL